MKLTGKTLVSTNDTGVFNEQNGLIHIEDIESMDILDPFDVSVRVNDLLKLKDKWYDGNIGKPINEEQINLFKNLFDNYYDSQLKLPAIFPTIEGNIVLEWKNQEIEISLEINLNDLNSELFYFDMNNDDNDYDKIIDLKNESDWLELNQIIANNIYNEQTKQHS